MSISFFKFQSFISLLQMRFLTVVITLVLLPLSLAFANDGTNSPKKIAAKSDVQTINSVGQAAKQLHENFEKAKENNAQKHLQMAPANTSAKQVHLRIFKSESLIELWTKHEGQSQFSLTRTFKVCKFSGGLGPKIKEGDRQAPEGIYNLPAKHILWNSSKWPRALNMGYPNVYDLAHKRTGSFLLIHGGCKSTGCFAITNSQMSELYKRVKQAKDSGQGIVSIHVFPFRLTEKNLAKHTQNKWYSFWKSLQPFYQRFEATKQIVRGQLCSKVYLPAEGGQFARPDCMPIYSAAGLSKSVLKKYKWVKKAYNKALASRVIPKAQRTAANPYGGLNVSVEGGRVRMRLEPHVKINCNIGLASCRRWVDLHKQKLKAGTLPSDLIEYR